MGNLQEQVKKAFCYQRGCREVVRYEHFVAIIPVFSTDKKGDIFIYVR